ncbi:nucleolar protein GU2 eIF4A-1-family [Cryptosporidium ryanae]|uniref:nucleolar protein GU2 eIF4A-1-family n=1 Tax=Cryptosporidium ryanae TaxID=515981 RepID=UPI00351A88C5|nr:nucleolar protein GU2 eIF4A-1-family [Cryptosporidium ryanae]
MEHKRRKLENEINDSIDLFPLSKETKDILKKRGIERLFPIQARSFDPIYHKKDVLGKAKTGTGKTLAFVLPVIERLIKKGKFDTGRSGRRPLVLVLLPTRELAQQVSSEFESLRGNERYKVCSVYGGSQEYPQIQEIKKGVDIVVGCPGRVLDFIERGILSVGKISVLTLDEADKMLEMGFKETVDKIIDYVRKDTSSGGDNANSVENKFQVLLFSATVPPWVRNILNDIMSKDTVTVDVTNISIHGDEEDESVSRSRIRHLAIQCGYQQRTGLLGDIIMMYAGINGKCIIFAETKQTANEIAMRSEISKMCQVLHGDIQQNQREIALQAFKEGRYRCLVATDVAARGLHIDDVAVVIQLAPPRDIDTYIHRSGRTGRAGKFGTAILFCNMSDYPFLSSIEKAGKISFQRIGVPQYEEIIQKTADSIGKDIIERNISSVMLDCVRDPAKNIIHSIWRKYSNNNMSNNNSRKRNRGGTEDGKNECNDDYDQETEAESNITPLENNNQVDKVPEVPEYALKALSYCLLELTGLINNKGTKKITHRSVLNGREDFKSYIITFNRLRDPISTNSYIWRCLKSNLRNSENLIEKIQCMTLLKKGNGAVFDVPAGSIKNWENAISNFTSDSAHSGNNFFVIAPATSNLPELSIPVLSDNNADMGHNGRLNNQHISNKIGYRNSFSSQGDRDATSGVGGSRGRGRGTAGGLSTRSSSQIPRGRGRRY